MSGRSRKQRIFDMPGVYCIRVEGFVDESAADSFAGMTVAVSSLPDGGCVSTLTGLLLDQAALAGVLLTIQEMGLLLLSAERIDEGATP